MKDLSNEELIQGHGGNIVLGSMSLNFDAAHKTRAELLSRLSAGEDAIKRVAELENDKRELVEALEAIRKVVVVACGDKAPYIKIALERLDAALAKHKEGL